MLDQLLASRFFLFGRSSVALMRVQERSQSPVETQASGSGLGLRLGRGRNQTGLGVDSGLRMSRPEVPRDRKLLGRGIESGGQEGQVGIRITGGVIIGLCFLDFFLAKINLPLYRCIVPSPGFYL